jgi:Leucine-rich repeat (LRR) protein
MRFRAAFSLNSSTCYLNLSNNLLEAENNVLHSFFSTFEALAGLEQLDLSFNRLRLAAVDQSMKDAMPILPLLAFVSFRGNPLERIEANLFHGLRESRLKELNFQECGLESIDPGRFGYI